ncbi:unnamed protein product [Penicillium pancosmium]
MPLLDLPTELILIIIDHLPKDRDRSALIRTNSNLYERFLSTLHAKTKASKRFSSIMLHLGAKAGFVPSRRRLPKLGGKTPLMVAFKDSQFEVATVIMNHDPSTINQFHPKTDITPLGMAIKSGNKNAVGALLARPELDPIFLDSHRGKYVPYISLAIAWADPQFEDIIDLLLSDSRFMFDKSMLEQVSNTALSLRCIGKYLSRGKDDVAEMGSMMLENAARQNRQDLMEFPFEELDGIDPAILSGRAESRALLLAADSANEGIIKLLLARKNVMVEFGFEHSPSTPLWRATARGAVGIVELLVNTGKADVNAEDLEVIEERAALSLAASLGFVKTARILLSSPAIEPDLMSLRKRTALAYASAK